MKKIKPITAWAIIDPEGFSTLNWGLTIDRETLHPYAIYPTEKPITWNKKVLKQYKAEVIKVLITPIN